MLLCGCVVFSALLYDCLDSLSVSMILRSINMTQVPPSLYVYGIFHLPVEIVNLIP